MSARSTMMLSLRGLENEEDETSEFAILEERTTWLTYLLQLYGHLASKCYLRPLASIPVRTFATLTDNDAEIMLGTKGCIAVGRTLGEVVLQK